MSRYRWIQTKWPFSIRALAKRMKVFPYSKNDDMGFVIDRVRDDYLEARYIERYEISESIVDPFGTETIFQHIEFRQCAFRASSDSPGLELIDSPRGAQNLLNRLAEITEFKLSTVALDVNVADWASRFQVITDVEAVIDLMQIGAVELGGRVSAKVIIKGDKDVQSACVNFISGRESKVEKIQMRPPSGKRDSIILTSSASAIIRVTNCYDEYLAALRQSLADIT